MADITTNILKETKEKFKQQIAEKRAELAELVAGYRKIDSILKASNSDSDTKEDTPTNKKTTETLYRGAITKLVQGLFETEASKLWSPKEIAVQIENWKKTGKLSIKSTNYLVSAYTVLRKFFENGYLEKTINNGEVTYRKKVEQLGTPHTHPVATQGNETFLQKITNILVSNDEPMSIGELYDEYVKITEKPLERERFRISVSIGYKKPKSRIMQLYYPHNPLLYRYLYALKDWTKHGLLDENYIEKLKKRGIIEEKTDLFRNSN